VQEVKTHKKTRQGEKYGNSLRYTLCFKGEDIGRTIRMDKHKESTKPETCPQNENEIIRVDTAHQCKLLKKGNREEGKARGNLIFVPCLGCRRKEMRTALDKQKEK